MKVTSQHSVHEQHSNDSTAEHAHRANIRNGHTTNQRRNGFCKVEPSTGLTGLSCKEVRRYTRSAVNSNKPGILQHSDQNDDSDSSDCKTAKDGLCSSIPCRTLLSYDDVSLARNVIGMPLHFEADGCNILEDSIGSTSFACLSDQHIDSDLPVVQNASNRLALDKCDSKILTRCEWDNCDVSEMNADSLIDHIRTAHVSTQVKPVTDADEEATFVCLWAGCKVYNKPSCLQTWLERHIHCHVGAKPLKCIVAGCGARFASQFMLERHVNGHFTLVNSPSASALRMSRKGDTGSKVLKKRKLRSLRPCPVKADDFFDSYVMDTIRKKLVTCAEQSSGSKDLISGNTITFQSSCSIEGKRYCDVTGSGFKRLPDEWLSEFDDAATSNRTLPLSCLPCDIVYKLFQMPKLSTRHFHRHRRK